MLGHFQRSLTRKEYTNPIFEESLLEIACER